MMLPVEAEEGLIANLISTPENLDKVAGLKSEHFSKGYCASIFDAMKELDNLNVEINFATVLAQANKGDRQVNKLWLAELLENQTTFINPKYFMEIILDAYQRRVLGTHLEKVARIASQVPDMSNEDLIARAQEGLDKITKEDSQVGLQGLEEMLPEAEQRMEENMLRAKEGGVVGVPTGFRELDLLTGGWQDGDYIILAARPGMGKSAFALDLAKAACCNRHKVAFFSLEMPKWQLLNRLWAAASKVNAESFRTGDLTEEEKDRLPEGLKLMSETLSPGGESHLFIDDHSPMDILKMKMRAKNLKKQEGLDLIIVDYLQIMASVEKKDNRELEVSSISKGLRELAKELELPVIALAQVSRGLESRPDKRPRLSDLRESGSIENDGHLIMFLHRESVYAKIPEDKTSAELHIKKNRHGKSPVCIDLLFYEEFATFRSASNTEGVGV